MSESYDDEIFIDEVPRAGSSSGGIYGTAGEPELLGLLLVPHPNAAEAVDAALAAGLLPEHFACTEHAQVFTAIINMKAAGRTWTEPELLAAEMGSSGAVKLVAELLRDGSVAFSAAAEYAAAIRAKSAARREASAAEALHAALLSNDRAGAERARAEMAAAAFEASSGRGGLADRVLTGDAILDRPAPEPLVEGLLDLDTFGLLFGQSGAGKSFLALDLALSVATGTWWHGRRVEAGPVLYVAAEGAAGLGSRVAAWQARRQVWTTGELHVLPVAVNLLDPGAVDELVALVSRLGARLTLLDTVARSIPGGDENSAKDMGMAVEAAERIRRASGGCVLAVHHSGKDTSAGARGSSALRAAVATELELTTDEKVLTLRQTKQRDRPEGLPERFVLVASGDSCAVEQHAGPVGAEPPPGALAMLADLAAIADDDGASATAWRVSTSAAERSFYRWAQRLVEAGFVERQGSLARARFVLTPAGRAEVARAR